jgi:hypothetical protein
MSAYQSLTFRIASASPFLMHNGQLSDPLSEASQSLAEVHAKKKKTENDHKEMSRREYLGGLYMDENGPCIPAEMLEAMIIGGAKKDKMGQQAKAAIIVENHASLEYDGPRDPKELWESGKFVYRTSARVGMSRVQRTRPRFKTWEAEFEVRVNADLVNPKKVKDFIVTAGEQIGIGDWRPKFGRFLVA